MDARSRTVGPGTCVVVGAGPAGMVVSLLLVRAGVRVSVLEKQGDFLRDFRGDTVHASTLTLLDELGLGEAFERLGARFIERVGVDLDTGHYEVADLTRLTAPHRHIALVPQWDFLELLAEACRDEPTHTLRMGAEVTGLLVDDDDPRRVRGVRYSTGDSEAELRADLVIACDGRDSTVRAALGRRVRAFGVPIDVLWFRLPRRAGDPEGGLGRAHGRTLIVLIDRDDYFQVGMLIPKGSSDQVRADGVEAFRARLAEALPWLGDRVDDLGSLDDVKLLSVQLDRLRRWWSPGLLLIGDAAHAMSPVGGVGINLAVQDAVAAARLIGPRLAGRRLRTSDLVRVQGRRWWPAALTQFVQRLIHHFVLAPIPAGGSPSGSRPAPDRAPALLRLLRRFPALQAVPAAAVAIGPLPEHAPAWARRPPRPGRCEPDPVQPARGRS